MTVRSDTAGPSDHTGLVRKLREDAKIDDAAEHGMWSEDRVKKDSRWQAAAAIAALSRAPEGGGQ